MAKKTITVSGLTEKQREKELEKVKSKYEKKGFKFIEYIDNGMTKSTAIFEVDEAILKKEKTNKIILFVIIISVIIYISTSSSSTKNDDIITDDYSVKEAKKLPLHQLKQLSTNFVVKQNLNDKYNQKFYNCLGQMVWGKDDTLKTSKLLTWCYSDYLNTPNNSMKTYYNTAELLSDFSAWDGSYNSLVTFIKSRMKDADSFEHVQTTNRLVYHGVNRPHMIIVMKYRGTNSFGAKVLGEVSAKVDAVTKEVYDIQ